MADARPPEGAWLRIAEAAALAGVRRQTVHQWVRRRHVLAARVGGAWWIERASLERLVRLRAGAAGAGVRVDTLLHWAGAGEPAPGEDAPVGGVEEEEDALGPRVRLAQAGDEGDEGGVVGEAGDLAERAEGAAGLQCDAVGRGGGPG
jgi:excisionase family DNA binding protein